MKDKLIKWVQSYTEQTNAKGYVLGISGGKDSAVVAALLCEAIGKDKVLGILMPNGGQKDISDSYEVCEVLGIDYQVVNIRESYDAIFKQIESTPEVLYPGDDGGYCAMTTKGLNYDITKEAAINIAPRLRMTTLYTIAQSVGYRVAGTGNRSERYVGYCTKWGDMAADINPIAGLTMHEVLDLGDELGLPHHLVHKTPSDGLCGLSDEDKMGFTYRQLDDYILKGSSGDEKVDKVIKKKHLMSAHKRGVYAPAYCIDEVDYAHYHWREDECHDFENDHLDMTGVPYCDWTMICDVEE
jgi:NAD+ synthase